MRNLVIFFILISMPAAAMAAFTTRVCEADGTTLFDNRDIMVGTKLTIIVTSDSTEWQACDLVVLGDFQNYGMVTGRDWNDVTLDYEGSHFPAAGDAGALVTDWIEEGILGISMYPSDVPPRYTGDWFIVDYTATAIGDCNVAFFENLAMEPSYFLPTTGSFQQVATRDFNQDTVVDFGDYAILASYWQQSCSGPGWCEGADLDTSGSVNLYDLAMFCDYWLEATQ